MKTRLNIPFSEVKELLEIEQFEFPKYATQILNLANQNAQGTRPAVVGQMSELIQEFSGKNIKDWEKWYVSKHPDAIRKATIKIKRMVDNFKSVINQIDEKMIENWVKDLVIIKTFIGLRFQEAILKKIAGFVNEEFRLSSPGEEAQGIDGFIGEQPVSIKPITYKTKASLLETLNAKIVYYEKTKNGFIVDFESIVKSKE